MATVNPNTKCLDDYKHVTINNAVMQINIKPYNEADI